MQARQIIAEADREKGRIEAEAYSQAQRVKAEGDAQATRIYSSAFSRNPAFYKFLRTLQAYEKFLDENTTLFLPADAEVDGGTLQRVGVGKARMAGQRLAHGAAQRRAERISAARIGIVTSGALLEHLLALGRVGGGQIEGDRLLSFVLRFPPIAIGRCDSCSFHASYSPNFACLIASSTGTPAMALMMTWSSEKI